MFLDFRAQAVVPGPILVDMIVFFGVRDEVSGVPIGLTSISNL